MTFYITNLQEKSASSRKGKPALFQLFQFSYFYNTNNNSLIYQPKLLYFLEIF
jgi:hypothetical protein